jgi:LCP family protein required for cell wall assembly
MAGSMDNGNGAGKRRADADKFRRRHRKIYLVLVTLAVVFSLGIFGTGAYAYMLNKQLGNVDKVHVSDKLKEADRPDPDKGRALNILLLGSDKGKKIPGESENTTLAEDAKAAKWPVGKYRSDTLMIVHITADRKSVYLASIPRDTFTTIYDAEGNPHGQQKINAAFSEYGAVGAISTVEHLTNLRMKHVAIIDWAGFKDLSTAVGGVPVTIPKDTYDDSQHVMWKAGKYNLEGSKALQYVRQRHGLLRGDFDRIARQQNFLRALMTKMLSKGVTRNPVKLINTVKALTKNLTVDEEWTGGDMRGLALSLRGMQTKDVYFLSAPVAGTETVPIYGSIVRLDELKSKELFTAFREDDLKTYLDKYPDEILKDQVS